MIDPGTIEKGLVKEPLLTNEDDPENRIINARVYTYRWFIVFLFVLSGVANAMILLSWAPITDKAQTYWDNIGITEINLLNVIFQIMYLPGTMLALYVSEKYNLRSIIVTGGALTTVGCVLRVIGVVSKTHGLTSAGSYALVLFGTLFVGLAQPFYINMPAKIATTWFAVNERDIATTFCSLANPLGSAIGSFIPPMFVTGDSEKNISNGIEDLVLTQLATAAAALIFVLLFFRSQPPLPPSYTASTKQSGVAVSNTKSMTDEVITLFKNPEYLKLFISFSIILGNLNALAALLNQLPGGYSNGEVGLTGAVLISCGFMGAFSTGFVLDYTKAYRTVLKMAYVLTAIFWIFFAATCVPNMFGLFIGAAAMLGFFTLPTG